MSRYIDADNAIERLGAYLMTDAQIEYGGLASEDIEDWKPIAIDILKGAPSIDIVKCADCKYDHKCNHSQSSPPRNPIRRRPRTLLPQVPDAPGELVITGSSVGVIITGASPESPLPSSPPWPF